MDIALEYNADGQFDISIDQGDLKKDIGLETAVIISLFTNQRVTSEELPDLFDDRGGWWGDSISEVDGDQIGSKLWLVFKTGKLNNETLEKIESYSRESLSWMIEDKLCSSVIAEAELIDGEFISLSIELAKEENNNILYSFLWDGQKIMRG